MADLIGIERKKTFSCGAVRLTKPRPIVARNMTMITGAAMMTVVRSMPSRVPRTWRGALGAKSREGTLPGTKTGQTA